MSGLGVHGIRSEKSPGQDGCSSGGERKPSGGVSLLTLRECPFVAGRVVGAGAEAGPSWWLGLGPCLQGGGLALDGGGGLWKSCTAVGFKMWLGGSWWFADELGTGHSGRVVDAAGVWPGGWAGTGLWVDGVGKLWFQTEIPSS